MKTDAEIQKDVMDELKWVPLLKSTEIGVGVKNGIVTLSGVLDTYGKKALAEKAATRVAGVKAVADDLEVKLSPGGKRTDTEIAEAVLNALKWHSAMQENKIKVKVDNGWVTLEGECEWAFQRTAAATMVKDLMGVTGIANNIKIVPALSAHEVKHKIAAAFHRSATVDSGKVNIQVIGNKVTLTGTVRSFVEKKDAENAAWLAPGVNAVENKLSIDYNLFSLQD